MSSLGFSTTIKVKQCTYTIENQLESPKACKEGKDSETRKDLF